MHTNNMSVILIGMPGAGKSTIGRSLAKFLAKKFIDTDLLIALQEKKSLQEIIDKDGYLALRAVEEKVLLDIHHTSHVIATGGSVVYSSSAMRHLQNFGPIIFLDVSLEELISRVKDIDARGLARRPDQSFNDLYHERRLLYQEYANITVSCTGKTQEQVLKDVISRVTSYR